VQFFLLLFLVLLFFYPIVHFSIFQFKKIWKHRSLYKKILTIIVIIQTSYIIIANLTLSIIEISMIKFIIAYFLIHFIVVQFNSDWKTRNIYQKFLTIIYILLISSILISSLILYLTSESSYDQFELIG